MDPEKLFEFSQARFEHAAQRQILREKYQAKLTFAHQGGLWLAGPELLSTLSVCDTAEVVLLDLYQNPVKVTVSELRQMTFDRWQEQMTAWLIEHQEMSRQR